MKKVFLDTNVLIDYLEGREGAQFAQDGNKNKNIKNIFSVKHPC